MFFLRYLNSRQACASAPTSTKPASLEQVAKATKPALAKPAAVPAGKRLLTIDLDAPTEEQLRAVAKASGAFWGKRGGGRPKRASTPIAPPETGALPPVQPST